MFEKVVTSAKLFSLPDIYIELQALLNDPDFTMAEIALLVGRDPAIATRFLSIANSPLNRRLRKIETVGQAVSLLGVDQIHDIVLSLSVAKTFRGIESSVMNMKKFWQRSFYCAMAVKQLALLNGKQNSDRLFAIGLLHDIGHLFMYTALPEESQYAILSAKKHERPLYLVERELLGFDYAAVGGYVMARWALPESFQTIIKTHSEPSEAKEYGLESALLHLSVMLVASDLDSGDFGKKAFAVDPAAWETVNLTEENCLDARKEAAELYGGIADSYLS